MQRGDLIGPYQLTEPLGQGGMGVVWAAQDTRLAREVALKFLPDGVANDAETRARFEREARAASALTHPNICVLYDIGEHGGRPFIVMERLRGLPLDDRLVEGPLAEVELRKLALHVARALNAAHERDILHRDLKPANIFCGEDGQAKILDFGVAKSLQTEADGATELTAKGALLGTVKYMSPEQALGKPLDGRSDLFSLGAVLYEAATGAPPFAEGSVGATLNAVVNDDSVSLSGTMPALATSLGGIVDRLLQKDPAERFASAAHLVEALERAAASATSPSQPGVTPVSPEIGAVVGNAAPGPSVAVLPFANFSADPDSDFFSDGLAEELTTGLSRVKGLRVAARSSAFKFKDQAVDAQEAGRQLGVSSVLEGSVRRAGNRVRVSVQLVDVATGYQNWSDRYDGTLDDIFQIQEDTATAIIHQLEVEFGGSGERQVLRRHTENAEAYELYLRGRFHWERRAKGDQLQALQSFRGAVAIDPDYALAYAGIADVHWSLLAYGLAPVGPTRQACRQAIERAQAIDPDLPEAATSEAILATMSGDWKTAESLYDRAVQLDPNYWLSWAYRAMQEGCLLRQDAVDDAVRRVLELEPESQYAWSICGLAYNFLEQQETGIEHFDRALEFDAQSVVGHFGRGIACTELGRHDEAIHHCGEAVRLTNRAPTFLGFLAAAVGRSGDSDRCQRMLEELERRSATEYVVDTVLGIAYGGLGDTDKARHYYEKAITEERPPVWTLVMMNRPFPDLLVSEYDLPLPDRLKNSET